ncbi:MAG: RluA family pseudouridine synthase [Deltaproteobacteria bacterium]|nr:RluA family pseudouridine synthase [Deltaproteobacteria bacterium]
MRLDVYITKLHPEISRSMAKRLIENGNVRVLGNVIKKVHHSVQNNEQVEVKVPEPQKTEIMPQNIPVEIIYEDKDIIVINKSSGIAVHPGAGNRDGTLVNALLYRCRDLSGIGGELRPGIVHRLDKGTSGIMVVAKNDAAHISLSNQFKSRTVEKKYYALVYGKVPKEAGEIKEAIGRHPSERKKMSVKTKHGRAAETYYKVSKRFGNELTLVDIKLGSGRTHQIRVHFSYIGHPLVGDEVYGGKAVKRLKNSNLRDVIKQISRPFLHSYYLSFSHPSAGKKVEFESALPLDLQGALNELSRFESA